MIQRSYVLLLPLFVSAVFITTPPVDVRWQFLGCLLITGYPLIISAVSTHQWPLDPLNSLLDQSIERPIDYDNLIFNTDRSARVLNFFPVPVEEECLSEEKRRRGICMNTYECHIQHGKSHGPCALGFGVCCIFTASCGGEVKNNSTYIISPDFPNLIDRPMNCSLAIHKIDKQVSQLRIDFVHFNVAQPNARTGICDEDIMEIKKGNRSVFELCGWNSGQHLYIDVTEGDEPVTLDFRLSSELQSRMWEMRVVQLGFEQQAPIGCLQYFQSANGTLRTFNYLSNGRYLANHDYLLCVRQEIGMCGISYSPCNPESFRIGPLGPATLTGSVPNFLAMNPNTVIMSTRNNVSKPVRNNVSTNNSIKRQGSDLASNSGTNRPIRPGSASTSNPLINSGITSDANVPTNEDMENLIEGSGTGSIESQPNLPSSESTSSSSTDATRQCRDRVLIPCDFEEFITPGNDVASICSLEHCGNSLCGENELDADGNCRVETWATPFRIRVAFGPGQDTGTSLEDNVGMCLVYEQLPCVP